MDKEAALSQYRRIYNALLEAISEGKFAAGNKIPSEKELAVQYGVSRITSKKALDLLAEQGIISRSPGKGSFVRSIPGGPRQGAKTIGFILPDFSDAFGSRLLCGIEETCTALGYHLILKRTHDSQREEEAAIQSLSGAGPAGILIIPVHSEYYNSEILKQILNEQPLVFVDRRMRGLAVPSVSTDNAAAAAAGVELLLDSGHRNIAFFSGPVEHTSTVEDRWNGFVKVFTDRNIALNSALFCPNMRSSSMWPFLSADTLASDITLVKRRLEAHPEITAALVTEFTLAQIVQNAAQDLGRSVPADFSIVCFDSPDLAARKPFFTHLKQDENEIGKRAVEALHAIITGAKPASIGDIKIAATLVKGLSVRSL